ncbi:SulP family inorganic anion transporter [Tumebacillus permanentifrigoris]|uniref:SulP family sulfate permease n=1 Tax=Tumebacillus permanentifrigoris TaxID=378543 RepID=A0A316D7K8_9BACL|nr:SulP family inorganic anion transporter [Tumebacillus permanentifrigoris]PWK11558.1 SulP family sulfate permease [Tumebacillus permanentifrigoris]
MKKMDRTGYSFDRFKKDLLSGLIVGVIAIPLGMGFAIATGVEPEYGIYTTIFAGILISLFGGSKFQIGGPTGAFVPILFGIVATYGYENLLVAGFMAGLLLLIIGLLKLGSLIRFIPRPVTVGFTTGIAVIIFTGEIPHFLGIHIEKHKYFLNNMKEIAKHLGDTNFYSVLTAVLCFVVILTCTKKFPKVPGALLGIIISSTLASVLYAEQVATIGSTYGPISSSLPRFQLPNFSWETLPTLIYPALLIAFLGGIESLLSAVVADGMSKTKHDSNQELIGQGIANMVTPLFGGIPATGAIARTATNIRSGATSKVSGIIHGVVVLLTLLLFASYASHIALASIAPVLFVVAWNMSEKHHFIEVFKMKNSDSLVLSVTFLFTVFTDLTTAVLIGLGVSVILFTKRMGESLAVKHVKQDCPQIRICAIEGSMFFGSVQAFENTILESITEDTEVWILRMDRVPFLDSTCEASLKTIITDFKDRKGMVLIAKIQPQPKELMLASGLYDIVGQENFFEHMGDALKQGEQLVKHSQQPHKKETVFEPGMSPV